MCRAGMKKRDILELPAMQVVYCMTAAQQEIGCEIIEQRITDEKPYHVWGFDCEWKVSYIAGQAARKVSLIQFGSKDVIVLFHVFHSGIHSTLIDIIKSSRHVKLGVNILGDIQKLERDFPTLFGRESISGVCDIRRISEVTGVPPQRSLAGDLTYLAPVLHF